MRISDWSSDVCSSDLADILACDTNRARLQQLPPRAERAGATRIETRLLNPGQEPAMLADWQGRAARVFVDAPCRSEEHTSELQTLMRISYAVICLQQQKIYIIHTLYADLHHTHN